MASEGPGLDEVVREFVIEGTEALDQLDVDLVRLEREPSDAALVASVFRHVHTIKGSCGWLKFERLEALTHAAETLMSRVRARELAITAPVITALLRLVDAVRAALEHVAVHGTEPPESYTELIAHVEMLARGEVDGGALLAVEHDESLGHAEGSVRVDVALLDDLVNKVGELVLVRNQLIQLAALHNDSALSARSQKLNLVTSELQERIMKTRMQPIGNLWKKFPRLVRDLATALGKTVRVTFDGADTELDRTLIEAVRDPLTHVVRNAIDHGIESPTERRRAGKTDAGTVSLRAFHQAGQVVIEVKDDGAGIDLERIRQRAIEIGISSAERLRQLGPREVQELIFFPGFSTTKEVTNVSGRGVGMDVVKTNIEKVGGVIDVSGEAGVGTTVRMKIPLTLAIIPALIVTNRGQRYAIPQASLVELIRLEGKSVQAVESAYGVPVYRSRGKLLPLVYLSQVLGLWSPGQSRGSDDSGLNIAVLDAEGQHFGMVVDGIQDTEEIVVKPLGKALKNLATYAGATIMGDGKVALILDAAGIAASAKIAAEDGVTHATPAAQAEPATPAQATRPILLVSVNESRLALPLDEVDRLEEFATTDLEYVGTRKCVQYRGAILRLVHVAELLEERRSLPRTPEADSAGPERRWAADLHADERLQVVVQSNAGRRVGLIVDRILDTVDETLQVRDEETRRGVTGTAVIRGRITELLDMNAAFAKAQEVGTDAAE